MGIDFLILKYVTAVHEYQRNRLNVKLYQDRSTQELCVEGVVVNLYDFGQERWRKIYCLNSTSRAQAELKGVVVNTAVWILCRGKSLWSGKRIMLMRYAGHNSCRADDVG